MIRLTAAVIMGFFAAGAVVIAAFIVLGDSLEEASDDYAPQVREEDALSAVAQWLCPVEPQRVADRLRAGADTGTRVVWIANLERARFAVERDENGETRVVPLSTVAKKFAEQLPTSCFAD